MKKKDLPSPTAPPRKGKDVKLAAKMIVRDGAKHREALIAAGFTPRQAGKGAKGIALLHRGFRTAMSQENRRKDKELEMLGLNTSGETRAAIARGVLHNEAVNADASRDRIN